MVRVGFSEVTFKLKRRRKHSVVEEVHPREGTDCMVLFWQKTLGVG